MKKDVLLMRICIALLMISSFSLLLVYFADFDGSGFQQFLAYAIGVIFWSCLIAGYVVLNIISKHRKKYERKESNHRERKKRTKQRPGVITFFSDRAATAVDMLMILSIVICLIFLFIPSMNQNVAIFFIVILIASIHLHSIMNGINFKYISTISRKKESRNHE